MAALTAVYTQGTYRLLPPEQTLAQITPHLNTCGITRCASITGLDVDLGVPTYCAIRPRGRVLQTANGKGLSLASAKVSAMMEAIELHHAENPTPSCLQRCSLRTLSHSDVAIIRPHRLPAYSKLFFSDDYIVDWVQGEALLTQTPCWLPASAVYFWEPALYRTSTNGLASGNHLTEAILHALFELIERDAIARLEVNGRLKIKERCLVIDVKTIPDTMLQKILSKIEDAQSKLVLLWVPSCVPVHTFWAVLLNKASVSALSTFNAGCGAHCDPSIAAARAITEAIQSRLTLIHGARDDIIAKPVYKAVDSVASPAYHYFDHLESKTTWQRVAEQGHYANTDLQATYDYLLSTLAAAGHDQIFSVDLTKPEIGIPVVKVIVPSLQLNRQLI